MSHLNAMQAIPRKRLAQLVGVSERQISRLARNGDIPDVTRPDGYHFQYNDTKALRDWIDEKRRKVKARKSRPLAKPRRQDRGVETIHGLSMGFEIYRRRVEPYLSSWDHETLKNALEELKPFVAFHERLENLMSKINSAPDPKCGEDVAR